MTIFIFLSSLLGAMAIGMPIAYALLVCGVALMVQLDLFDSQIIAQNIINGADSFPLMAVPFFMLAGEIMNVGGLSKRIVNLALALIGHVRGGLGYVAIMAACLLAALSGSAVADAAALGALLVPMMVKAGHDKPRSAGLVAAAGIIGPIIPPSIAFVVFGVASGLSISKLFLAGIFPGLYLGIGLAVAWWLVARKENLVMPPRATGPEKMRAFIDSLWALMAGRLRRLLAHLGDSQDGEHQKSADHGSLCHHHCPNAALDAVRDAMPLALAAMRPFASGTMPLGNYNPRPPVEPPAA